METKIWRKREFYTLLTCQDSRFNRNGRVFLKSGEAACFPREGADVGNGGLRGTERRALCLRFFPQEEEKDLPSRPRLTFSAKYDILLKYPPLRGDKTKYAAP